MQGKVQAIVNFAEGLGDIELKKGEKKKEGVIRHKKLHIKSFRIWLTR